MTAKLKDSVLADHVDMRMVSAALEIAADRNNIVQLDPDHPGFRDAEYRARRNRIAEIALAYQPGTPIPDAVYTPEAYVVHEIIGHGVTLASERLAELNRLFGAAVKRTSSANTIDQLARVYWFTIEFGVLREGGGLKAYGTGLLSSAGELEAMHKAELQPLDLTAISHQEYDPTQFQPVLFCADSFDSMCEMLRDYLVRWK